MWKLRPTSGSVIRASSGSPCFAVNELSGVTSRDAPSYRSEVVFHVVDASAFSASVPKSSGYTKSTLKLVPASMYCRCRRMQPSDDPFQPVHFFGLVELLLQIVPHGSFSYKVSLFLGQRNAEVLAEHGFDAPEIFIHAKKSLFPTPVPLQRVLRASSYVGRTVLLRDHPAAAVQLPSSAPSSAPS